MTDAAAETTIVVGVEGDTSLPFTLISLAPDTTMVVGDGGALAGAGAGAGDGAGDGAGATWTAQFLARANATAASAMDFVITGCKGARPERAQDVACARVTAAGAGGVGAGGAGVGAGGTGVGGTGVGAGGVGAGGVGVGAGGVGVGAGAGAGTGTLPPMASKSAIRLVQSIPLGALLMPLDRKSVV